ncbi:MAG TPA: SDR family NAD(P)-dependent oxidoreductase [Puia sp.]|jgi:NAD(P)-dependent dehydrogenase (short-subunit alcohol dehydrogenase family)|nr:SDR family NAD(P)-dependent oxidoreductase [Puia sp.]
MPKTIIITGANGNLGTVTVKKFLAEGYRVIAVDHSGSHLDFAKGNPDFELRSVNLVNEPDVNSFVQEVITKYKSVDGALMLAGGFSAGNLQSTSGEDLKNLYSLNFETAFFITRSLVQHMLTAGYGRLVFIGARPALVAGQGKAAVAYALTKSLLFKLAELVNADSKGKNVVASVVAPSTLDTALNRKDMPDANPQDWVKPEQVADILEFICSDKGSPLRESIYKVYNNA